MIITPPQLNGLRIKQQSFRYFMEQLKWNYILEDEANKDYEDEVDDEADEDNRNVDNEDNTSSSTTSYKSASTMR